MGTWFAGLPVQVQAALVGASASLAVFLLRDLVMWAWRERRQAKKSTTEIFRRYADPLAASATSLLWRLNEVFHMRGRGSFLRTRSPLTQFESYKQRSTAYRLGALMGWIRAYRRELQFLTLNRRSHYRPLQTSISALESALADGPHIEMMRLRGVATVLDLALPDDRERVEALAVELDWFEQRFLHRRQVALATDLSGEDQLQLCRQTAQLLCERLDANPLQDEYVSECRASTIRQLAVRQGWLYRDWQSGIGDLMTREASHGPRRFEVIGYRRFEALFEDGTEEEQRWLNRLARVLVDLDVAGEPRFDARIQQLRNTLVATAKILISLEEARGKRSGIAKSTIALARQLVGKESDAQSV